MAEHGRHPSLDRSRNLNKAIQSISKSAAGQFCRHLIGPRLLWRWLMLTEIDGSASRFAMSGKTGTMLRPSVVAGITRHRDGERHLAGMPSQLRLSEFRLGPSIRWPARCTRLRAITCCPDE